MPNTKQIVDRFHILKNYIDDMCDYMKRTLPDNIKINGSSQQLNNDQLNRYDKEKNKTAQRKWNVICKVKELKKQEMSNKDIGIKLGICDETMAKYLKIESMPIQDSHSKLDDYIPDIKEQIIEGKTKKQIYEHIKNKGYKGKESILYHRIEIKKDIVSIKRSKLKKVFFVDDIKQIKNKNTRDSIVLYLQHNKEFNRLLTLFREFKNYCFLKMINY